MNFEKILINFIKLLVLTDLVINFTNEIKNMHYTSCENYIIVLNIIKREHSSTLEEKYIFIEFLECHLLLY